jgi:hypothetical protein
MNSARLRWIAAVAVILAAGVLELRASGPAALYAIVQKVVLEPNDTAPERIQVWGVFSIWDSAARSYSAPERGYMYFKLPGPADVQWRSGGNRPSAPIALAEWADLKRVAGNTNGVAFGEQGYWRGRLRKPDEKPDAPDPYPIYNGITQLSGMDQDGPAILVKLREFAARR